MGYAIVIWQISWISTDFTFFLTSDVACKQTANMTVLQILRFNEFLSIIRLFKVVYTFVDVLNAPITKISQREYLKNEKIYSSCSFKFQHHIS